MDHKKIITRNVDKLEGYYTHLRWQRLAAEAGGSTRHITTQYNKLFDELVTKDYLNQFKIMLQRLGRKMSVAIETRASKGQVFKQLVVAADPSIPFNMKRPEKVLSEGEKRAVAFADFLTEALLDNNCKAIVLDDPVTSLDIHWKDQLAILLAQEATTRQIITFTHDLTFLYLLVSASEEQGIPFQTHLIEKGQLDDQPGYVQNNSSPAAERFYRKPTRAIDCYTKAKTLQGEVQTAMLREGFASLRSSYEALIIFDILNEVVVRFDARIRYGNLTEVVVDYGLFRVITQRYEFCSRYMEGHLHTDSSPFAPISISLLQDEINTFNGIKQEVRQLKSSIPKGT